MCVWLIFQQFVGVSHGGLTLYGFPFVTFYPYRSSGNLNCSIAQLVEQIPVKDMVSGPSPDGTAKNES